MTKREVWRKWERALMWVLDVLLPVRLQRGQDERECGVYRSEQVDFACA